MKTYPAKMLDVARQHYSELFADVKNVAMLDFPDYDNIGDSAIFLGLYEFFRATGIRVDSVSSMSTLRHSTPPISQALVIQGGGSFGGMYPESDYHRSFIVEEWAESHLIIQAPQSIAKGSAEQLASLIAVLAGNQRVRVAARDQTTLEIFRAGGIASALAPDSVHFLGNIEAPEPTEDFGILFRRDNETTSSELGQGFDWPESSRFRNIVKSLRQSGQYHEGLAKVLSRKPIQLHAQAASKVALGVGLITPYKTLITDRLHGMLLALQMGRSVIAVDNVTGKLSDYANTWFSDLDCDLVFSASHAEALDVARLKKTLP